ncbi:CopG family transcriptional regulator [Pseudofrankia asymbiotica]|uniref:CopG family transcriptional regulator n=1 Tax=Pseudofrankia asymbiotica TaxID=1834516 RepID=UPI000976522D|nr:CopG family transcriptional regulator [Pseudofrankia asymbiotica]
MRLTTIKITIPEDLPREVRAAAGERGVSAYLIEVLRHRQAQDRLRELVDWLEEEYGPITEEERAAAQNEMKKLQVEHKRRRAELHRDRNA